MAEQLHDDTFHPFIIADGRCVVASEAEWARIERAATVGVRILVGDVFAEWDVGFVRSRLFSMIDRTAATWCVETRHPENIERMMPGYHPYGGPRFNVHLYAGPIYTQADADAMIPALLRCPAAMRGLVVTPGEEIDLSEWMYTIKVVHNGDTQEVPCRPDIKHVIIRGDSEPMHPAHVRSIVEQCKAAGVPVWFETWGEWAPIDTVMRVPSSGLAYLGSGDHETTMSWVSRARSGSMLDGIEYRELPEATK